MLDIQPNEMMDSQPPVSPGNTQTPKVGFLLLPAELRLCIYHYVFANTLLLARKGERRKFSPHLVLLQGTPQLLFVCRTTFEEGLPVFWSEALLHAGLTWNFSNVEYGRLDGCPTARQFEIHTVVAAIPARSRPLVRHLRHVVPTQRELSCPEEFGECLRQLEGLRTCELSLRNINCLGSFPREPGWGCTFPGSMFDRLNSDTCAELLWQDRDVSSPRSYLARWGWGARCWKNAPSWCTSMRCNHREVLLLPTRR
ncbi:hypothetical protein PG988_003032 [Apiospora saccharicola]